MSAPQAAGRDQGGDPQWRTIKEIVTQAKSIAVVGLSSRPERHSNVVASYLLEAGYRIFPVNPNETSVFGVEAVPTLTDLPEPVDVVDVFRRPEFVPEIARQTVEIGTPVLWLQPGAESQEAVDIARQAGITPVAGLCMMVEHRGLMRKRDDVRPHPGGNPT